MDSKEEASADRLNDVKKFVKDLDGQLKSIRDKLENTVKTVEKNPFDRGNTIKIERLLNTTFLRASQRRRLLEAVRAQQDRALTGLQVFTKEGASGQAASKPVPYRIAEQAELEVELAALVGMQPTKKEGPADVSDRPWDSIREAQKALKDANASRSDSRLTSFRELAVSLKQFYGGISHSIQAHAITREVKSLQAQERLLRAIDARDVHKISSTIVTRQNPIEAIRQTRLFELLAWHQGRLELLQSAAAPADRDAIFEAANRCYKLAMNIRDQRGLKAPERMDSVARIRILPVQKLGEDSWKLTVEITPSAAAPTSAKLRLVHNQPKLVEIRHRGKVDDLTSVTVPLDLQNNKTTEVFDIKARPRSRLEPGEQTVRLTARLLSGERGERIEDEKYVDLDTEPQVVELKVEGFLGFIQPVEQPKRMVTLRPFPNRSNDFRLKVTAAKPTEVRIRLLALDESIPISERARINDNPGVLRGTDIKVKSEAEYASITPGAPLPVEIESRKDQGDLSVTAGLVCIIEEKEPRTKTYYWIDIDPVHPREYLDPTPVRGDESGQVKIQIKAKPNSPFPPDGANVTFRVPKDENAPGKKVAELKDRQTADAVWVKPQSGRNLPVYLYADKYPRAFLFVADVRQNQATARPIDPTIRAIRVTKPSSGEVYGPRKSIEVAFEVDAGDAYRDGAFKVELSAISRVGPTRAPLSFAGDRMVRVMLEEPKGNGSITINPQITDFDTELETGGIENDTLTIFASLRERGAPEVRSNEVSVFMDGTPPSIGRIRSDSEVEKGQVFRIEFPVTDESKVEKVEVALSSRPDFDDFEKQTIKQDATPSGNGDTYVVEFPDGATNQLVTGLKYTILVRAKNKNLATWSFAKKEVQVIAKRTPTAGKSQPGATVLGTVILDGQPRAEATVTLTRPADPSTGIKLEQEVRKTTKDGKFKFENVPPGKYKLVATAAHEAGYPLASEEKSFEVRSPPTAPPPFELKLRLSQK
jgi:hypothetical protein